jgi:4'-phosphopantetheinyl transferase
MPSLSTEATCLPTTTWRYVAGEFGKPKLAAGLLKWDLHFNISHTRGLVACAIAGQEVGVDVERSNRILDLRIVRHSFAPEEIRILNSAPPKQQRKIFFRSWTLKEAFIKATGEGLRRPLDSFSFSLAPVRIAFHHERNRRPDHGDQAEWRFWEWRPTKECNVALAARLTPMGIIHIDAGPARSADIGPL